MLPAALLIGIPMTLSWLASKQFLYKTEYLGKETPGWWDSGVSIYENAKLQGKLGLDSFTMVAATGNMSESETIARERQAEQLGVTPKNRAALASASFQENAKSLLFGGATLAGAALLTTLFPALAIPLAVAAPLAVALFTAYTIATGESTKIRIVQRIQDEIRNGHYNDPRSQAAFALIRGNPNVDLVEVSRTMSAPEVIEAFGLGDGEVLSSSLVNSYRALQYAQEKQAFDGLPWGFDDILNAPIDWGAGIAMGAIESATGEENIEKANEEMDRLIGPIDSTKSYHYA